VAEGIDRGRLVVRGLVRLAAILLQQGRGLLPRILTQDRVFRFQGQRQLPEGAVIIAGSSPLRFLCVKIRQDDPEGIEFYPVVLVRLPFLAECFPEEINLTVVQHVGIATQQSAVGVDAAYVLVEGVDGVQGSPLVGGVEDKGGGVTGEGSSSPAIQPIHGSISFLGSSPRRRAWMKTR